MLKQIKFYLSYVDEILLIKMIEFLSIFFYEKDWLQRIFGQVNFNNFFFTF